MLQHLPVPIARTCLSTLKGWQKNHCRAEELPQRHLLAAAATSTTCAGASAGVTSNTGSAGDEHRHPLIPAGPGDPNPAGARDPWHLPASSIGGQPSPVPAESGAGGLEPHFFGLSLIDC